MQDRVRHARIEPRWPVVLAIMAVAFLLTALPDRVRALPAWGGLLLGILMLAPVVGVAATGGHASWARAERISTTFFFVLVGVVSLTNLGTLINAMLYRSSAYGGVQLLMSSIAIWVTNVLAFSMLYWQLDRGGPEARLRQSGMRPDWLFPQEDVPQLVAPDWRPTFIDYLFLGFSTATAFSPTEALPLTPRAMLLMMLESSISLVTIVVVAARSINILGS